MRKTHGSTDRLCMDIGTGDPKFTASMLRCNIIEFPRRGGAGRVSRCFGAGCSGPGARPGQGSSDPTSPRREASLFNLPGLRPGNFFVRACLSDAGSGAKRNLSNVTDMLQARAFRLGITDHLVSRTPHRAALAASGRLWRLETAACGRRPAPADSRPPQAEDKSLMPRAISPHPEERAKPASRRAQDRPAAQSCSPPTSYLLEGHHYWLRLPLAQADYSQAITRASAARVKRRPSCVVFSEMMTPCPFCIIRVESPAPIVAPISPEV